jgi:hypothetical protein
MAMSDRSWDIVKLFIDKLLIALIVGGLGLLGMWRVNANIDASKNEQLTRLEEYKQEKTRSLEDVKLKEAREQFWQQKRLDALADITGQCSSMSEVFFDYAGKENVPDRAKEASENDFQV